jgi:hypothetical protein
MPSDDSAARVNAQVERKALSKGLHPFYTRLKRNKALGKMD